MPYNNLISRTDAAALIPEDVAATITRGVTQQSAALTLFRNVPMSTAQQRMPVISALPTAYFVNGDTGLKQTTEVNWANKYLNVEELAAIVPIPEAVLDDASFDAWGAIEPLLEEAIGRALDAAIFFGVNKPASWPTDIVAAAVAAGNVVARGANTTGAQGGIAADISDLFATVEADGFDVNGAVANRAYRGRLRDVRDANGVLLTEVSATSLYGVAPSYPMRGLWPTGLSAAELIAGDFTEGILGVRQDFTYKVLDQAVIQDAGGVIQFNLAQQDMVALRVVARYAFQVANIINYDQATEANRYPFAVLRSPAA
ncbi:MAG: phage major capsid protein [Chloroflexi bacterium]|nr:phage major capsid protein [Chloroflexota bacterium]